MNHLWLAFVFSILFVPFYHPTALAAAPVNAAVPASQTQTEQFQRFPSPDGEWVAIVDQQAGSLTLERKTGESITVFPEGSTVGDVKWSPDSQQLFVVRTNWLLPEADEGVQAAGPIEIWQVRLEESEIDAPSLVFQSDAPPEEGPQQIVFGRWSPNGRYLVFWQGILSASILADGLPFQVLDVETGQVIPLGESTLLNPSYYSWSPDSAALAVTTGSYRSAQVNKWLSLLDPGTGQVTTVISETEQVPGSVAWSPKGDLIAYTAVPAERTGQEWADLMTFDNPAIAGRGIYLLDPATGQYRRLNEAETYQDAPVWISGGAQLCYVQRNEDQIVVMVADPATGQAEPVPGASQPLPETVGYYGQSNWEELLASCPDHSAEEASEMQLTLTELQNAAYPAEYAADGTAELTEGSYREPIPDSALEVTVEFVDQTAFGDLNGDGLEDAAVVLMSNSGGSGTFFDLFAVLNRGGRPAPVASVFLGDRIELHSVVIDQGTIVVHMTTQGPNDPLCCPTEEVTRRYNLRYTLAEDSPQAGGPAVDFTGVYTATLPAASSPGRLITLALLPDHSARMNTDYLNQEPPVVRAGTWESQDSRVTVNFTDVDGRSIEESITFELRDGGQLVAVEYDRDMYGSMGLTLQRE